MFFQLFPPLDSDVENNKKDVLFSQIFLGKKK